MGELSAEVGLPDRERRGPTAGSAWVTPPATQYYLYNRIIATPCAVLQPRPTSINTRGERPTDQPHRWTGRPTYRGRTPHRGQPANLQHHRPTDWRVIGVGRPHALSPAAYPAVVKSLNMATR